MFIFPSKKTMIVCNALLLVGLAIFILVPKRIEGTITDFSNKTKYGFSVKLKKLNTPLSLFYNLDAYNNPHTIYMWQDGIPLPQYQGLLSVIQQFGDGRYGRYKRHLAFSSIGNDFQEGQVYTYSVLLKPLKIYYVTCFLLLISLVLLIFGSRLKANNFYLSKIILLYCARCIGVMGLFLMCASIIGLMLGQSVFYKPPAHDTYVFINEEQFTQLIEPKQDESPLAYAVRMNKLVYNSTVHFFTIENSFASIHERSTPFLYNWVFWLRAAYGVLFDYAAYPVEYERAESALYRGYGYCSQRALMLADILRRNKIEAYALALNDHVVTRAYIDGNEIILDPDYGVSIPFALKKVYADFSVLDRVYAEFPSRIAWAHDVYSKHIEIEYPPNVTRNIEEKYNIVKWLIPALMLFFGIIIEYIVRTYKLIEKKYKNA